MGDEGKKTGKWPDNFKGKEVYNQNGTRVLKSDDIPFQVVILPDGTKKVLPGGADLKKVDFKSLPDLDENDLDKNVRAAQLYGAPKVDKDVMTEWNNYATWMKQKGYAGSDEMNHQLYSDSVLKEYKKEHPESKLTKDYIVPIQNEIQKYRASYIDDIKNKRVQTNFTPAPDYSNVMAWADPSTPGGKLDGFVGKYTSQFMFPSAYMDVVSPQTRIGFVDMNKNNGTQNIADTTHAAKNVSPGQ